MAEPIRFFFEQHLWASVTEGLRRQGVDVLTAQDAGRCGMPDPDQLAFATAEQRVMVTFDTDFLALHQSGVAHAGIAWCPEQKHSIGQLIDSLMLLHGVWIGRVCVTIWNTFEQKGKGCSMEPTGGY